ncbi:GNAT family N-acetyltransferase [Mycobacterium numidiamassiliense]|uniref:GNAT family N-acetyltransferase n=1 Tax=Mycobacterium numidiamassiliense TaxID=1841861 RepID=UPI001FE8CFE4|nr:GNAT family N-acetyltransferase [Mycobacterium numidiamassiliense]
MAKTQLRFVPSSLDDALAQPLLAELALEYANRYDSAPTTVLAWLKDNPTDEFAPPDGGMLMGLLDGQPVTGGGFRRFDAQTAELKRIWTDSAHRRRGYAAALLTQLEAEIAARGYRKIYLMTGNRQPEAEELYLATGYTRLPGPLPSEGPVFPIAFEKWLT